VSVCVCVPQSHASGQPYSCYIHNAHTHTHTKTHKNTHIQVVCTMLTCYSHAHTHTVATFCLISGRTQTLVCARAHTHTFTLMHVYSMLYTQASHCSTCADIHLHTHIYAQACVLNTEAFHCRTRADICLHTQLRSCMFAKTHKLFIAERVQTFVYTHIYAHACLLNTQASHCSTRADNCLHTHITLMHVC
jgi:hypothetical protein